MRYLGHDPDKLRVLDGGLVDWAAANHTVENQSRNLPNTTYSFEQKPELLATYEEVKSSQDVKSGHMLIDARPLQDFSNDSLGNAISMPFDKVILNGRLKDESETKRMFSKFSNESPILIYSKQGVQASLIWFSLELMGYHAKLYTLMDWQNHKNQRTNMAN
jgi:thiosulfate/3-mercaptopyruvate sulfurtransferase